MGRVVVREELLARIEEIARARHTTVEHQIDELLSGAVGRAATRHDIRRRLDSIAALTPVGIRQTDSVAMLREDRDQ